MKKHLENLETKLLTYYDLPKEFWNSLLPYLSLRTISADSTFILSKHDIFFVSEGYLSEIDTHGEVYNFISPLDFIIDINGSSHHQYNTITDGALLHLDLQTFETQNQRRFTAFRLFRNIVSDYWKRKHLRDQILLLDKKDRKREFIKQFPDHVFHIPNTLAASFLRMSYDYYCRLPYD